MYHRVFDRIDAVVGEQVWNFADFATAPGDHARRRQQEGRLHPRPPAQEQRPRPAPPLAAAALTPALASSPRCNSVHLAAPAAKSPRSASARGRSAPTGATSTRTPRWRRCTRPPTPASRSSTPPTSTATAAPSGWSGGCCASARARRSPSPRRWAGACDQTVENYSPEHFRAWNDRSRENLGVETLDLVQLHCPPTDLYYHPEVFEDLEAMVGEGRIAAYGVSVERVEEALKAIEYPNVASVQIIFNAFRQRPAGVFFAEAARRGVGDDRARAARVRPAVGQVHARDDVRRRRPSQLQPRTARRSTSARRSRACRSRSASTPSRSCARSSPEDATLAQLALRWILMHDAVSTVIPGARSPEQAQGNAAAAALPALDDGAMARSRRSTTSGSRRTCTSAGSRVVRRRSGPPRCPRPGSPCAARPGAAAGSRRPAPSRSCRASSAGPTPTVARPAGPR